MDTVAMEKVVTDLNDKAAKAGDSNDALKYSQAALNAANALCSLQSSKKIGSK